MIPETLRAFTHKETIDEVAEAVFKAHVKNVQNRSVLNILTTERDTIKKSLTNIMKAIEEGIFTETTKSRMEELEERITNQKRANR